MNMKQLKSKKGALWQVACLCSTAQWHTLDNLSDILQECWLKKPSVELELAILISYHKHTTTPGQHLNKELLDNSKLPVKSRFFIFAGSHHLLQAEQFLILNNYDRAKQHGHLFLLCIQLAVEAIGISWGKQEGEVIHRNSQNLIPRLQSQLSLKESVSANRLAPKMTFVLGMHRSGTSALTGMLCQAGFDSPADLMPPTTANPRGYWESWSIYLLNTRFLERMGSSWHDINPFSYGWEDYAMTNTWREELLQVLDKVFTNPTHPIVKDPRFCILLPGLAPWLESNLINFSFLMPVRHPFEVVRSLELREKIPCAVGIRLWLRYVFSSELASRGYPRFFFAFEQLLNNSPAILEKCKAILGAKRSEIHDSEATNYIDRGLWRQQASSILEEVGRAISRLVAEKKLASCLYELLIRGNYHSAENQRTIDELRQKWLLLL